MANTAPQVSLREQYLMLQTQLADEEKAAMQEMDLWFESEEVQGIIIKLKEYRGKTVPGSVAQMNIDNVLGSIENTKNWNKQFTTPVPIVPGPTP